MKKKSAGEKAIIYDQQGRIVREIELMSDRIEVADLASGIYILLIQTEKGKAYQSIFRKH